MSDNTQLSQEACPEAKTHNDHIEAMTYANQFYNKGSSKIWKASYYSYLASKYASQQKEVEPEPGNAGQERSSNSGTIFTGEEIGTIGWNPKTGGLRIEPYGGDDPLPANAGEPKEGERIAGDFYLVKYRDKEDDDFETYAQWGGYTVGWFVAGHAKAYADKHFYFIANQSIQQENDHLKKHISFLQGRLTEKIFASTEGEPKEAEGDCWLKNTPTKIFLQVNGAEPGDDYKDLAGVTWETEQVFENDLEYRLYNLYAAGAQGKEAAIQQTGKK